MTTPVVILVRPQLGENIGGTARVMTNFGLSELRLVAPRDGWPNAKAEAMAGHATAVLERVKLFDTTQEAVADLQFTLATTARDRAMNKPVIEPEVAAHALMQKVQSEIRSGILFGPERTGLENEDVVAADAVLTIPSHADYPSLNLSHAVSVMAYEWRKQVIRVERAESSKKEPEHIPASKEQLEGLFLHLEQALDAHDYFKAADKKPFMWRNIRTTFARAQMSEQEVQTWRGIIRALSGNSMIR